MALSYELISQFAKLVSQDKKTNTETTVYGTIRVDGEGKKYVQIDGSDQLTPIEDGSASANANSDERVSVLIKNHTATVTGNVSSPAARTGDVEDLNGRVTEVEKFDIVLAERMEANEAYIEELKADVAEFGDLKAATAKIEELEAKDVEITGRLDASEADIDELKTTKLDAEVADVKYATIEKLNATNATVAQLDANKASVEDLDAVEADIVKLNADKASVKDLEAAEADITKLNADKASVTDLNAANAKISNLEAEDAKINGTLTAHNAVIANLNASYASIDFANIKMAAVKELFAKSGIIKDLVVGDTSITGELVGVTLKGDLIEAGTLKADKLVVKGSDGIFYKLNVEAGGISAEEAPDDGLHGSVIVAKSITAEKVNVKDLVAFGATIGGFNITDSAIFSGAKGSVDNNAEEGIYLDSTGQFAIGDASNFIKYYKNAETGLRKLEISADTITFGTGRKSVEEAIDEITESTKEEVDNLQIGGRNLLLNSSMKETLDEWEEVGDILDFEHTVSGEEVVRVDDISSKGLPATIRLGSEVHSPFGESLLVDYSLDDYFGDYISSLCNLVVSNEPYIVSRVDHRVESQDYTIFFENDYYLEEIAEDVLLRIPEVGEKVYCIDKDGVRYACFANTVEITVFGKNLFNYRDFVDYANQVYTENLANESVEYMGEDCFTFRCWRAFGDSTYFNPRVPFEENTQYTFSFSIAFEGIGQSYTTPFVLRYTDGTTETLRIDPLKQNEFNDYTFTSQANKTVKDFILNRQNEAYIAYVKKDMLIEAGTVSTGIEPDKDPIVCEVGVNDSIEIDIPYSPTITVISDVADVTLDVTYYPSSGLVEKNGKQCLNIKHLVLAETKSIHQDILSRIARDSKCMFSGWFMIENLVKGTSNPLCTLTIGETIASFDLSTLTPGQWSYVKLEVDTTAISEDAMECCVEVITSDMTGDLYVCELKLEQGNKATDWTPAPEDVDRDLANATDELLNEIMQTNAAIEVTAKDIRLEVSETYAKKDELSNYTTKAEFEVKSDGIEARVVATENTLESGEFDQVKVKGKNYKMDAEGFMIEDVDNTNTIKTTITNDGMTVANDGNKVLIANHQGVNATDLHARTYLIIAGKSRFESYGSDRIGCFWIG